MLDALARVPRRWLLVGYGLVLALITLGFAWIAYRAMFGAFDVPDDDGYLLMSLRKFFGGEAIYEDVYSQYGPGVFVLVGGFLKGVGISFTNDGARDYNLLLWLASTLLAGLALLRLTRSFAVSVAGLLLTFLVLFVDANEPLHPGATIGFLLIAMVAAAAFLLPERPRAALVLLGTLGAALFSIKVNVGVFALVAAGFAAVATVPELRRLAPLRIFTQIGFVVLPFLLLNEHLGDADTLRFAAVVAIGAAGIVLISTRLPTARVPDLGAVAWMAIAVVVVVVFLSLVALITGTAPAKLIEGWFTRPAETPGIQWVRLLVDPWMWVWGAVGFGGAILAHTALGAQGETGGEPRANAALATGRIVVGLAIWVSLTGPVFSLPVELTQAMVVGAPLLWVAMIDPRGLSPQTSFLRVLIPAMAALQFLHAYPVPGSQLYWSTLLLVIVGGICIGDGVDELSRAGHSWRPHFHLWPALVSIPVVIFGAWLCLKPLRTEAREAKVAYEAGVPLGLPGTEDMRVSEPMAVQLRELVAGIRANCDTFMSIPAMNSLNIFAGQEPPTELAGPWPFFVNVSEQRAIVEKVHQIPRFCIVSKPDLLAFWAGFSGVSAPPRRPLVRYMEEDFRLKHDYSGYQLLIRKG